MTELETLYVLGDRNTIVRLQKNKAGEISYKDTVKTFQGKNASTGGKLVLEDRLAFVFGIISLLLFQFLILRQPHLVPHAYTVVLAFLVYMRIPLFIGQKEGLFLIDFCYFVNLSTIAQIFLAPENWLWFTTNYVLCLGCLMNAIVVWQNCLMLHSFDRLTSLFLHALAPLTLHVIRWSEDWSGPTQLGFWDAAVLPIIFYLSWQAAYLVVTEIILASWLAKNLDQSFSLRHLASDANNGVHQLVLNLLRTAGVMAPNEVFDASTFKTKLTMVTAQLIYTLITLVPVPFLFASYTVSTVYLGCIYLMVLWRGASDYMQDWADRRSVVLLSGSSQQVDNEKLCKEMQELIKTGKVE